MCNNIVPPPLRQSFHVFCANHSDVTVKGSSLEQDIARGTAGVRLPVVKKKKKMVLPPHDRLADVPAAVLTACPQLFTIIDSGPKMESPRSLCRRLTCGHRGTKCQLVDCRRKRVPQSSCLHRTWPQCVARRCCGRKRFSKSFVVLVIFSSYSCTWLSNKFQRQRLTPCLDILDPRSQNDEMYRYVHKFRWLSEKSCHLLI